MKYPIIQGICLGLLIGIILGVLIYAFISVLKMSKRTGTIYEGKLKKKLLELPSIITAVRSAGSKGKYL